MAELALGGVGLAFSGVAFALAFKGAVDSFLLFDSFFDNYADSGLKDLAIFYHIECRKFKHWGDKALAKDLDKSPLFNQPESVASVVLRIVQRIEELHKDGRKYLDIHDDAPGPVPASQQKYKLKHKVKWAIKNKTKFADVVTRLQGYNIKLDELLSSQERSSFKSTLPGYILALIDRPEDLEAIPALTGPTNVLVAHAARLKQLELNGGIGQSTINVDILSASDFTFKDPGPPQQPSSRNIGIYNKVQRVWIEWRVIEEGLSETQTSNLSLRLGLVLRPPAQYGIAQPTTLLQMIEGTAGNSPTSKEPPLGHKFALARTLASSLALLHAAKWLHKAFRSDNILFFGNPSDPESLRDIYISGFENSREATGDTTIANKAIFSSYRNIYSFGVVLVEIAYWRPLHTKIAKGKALGSLEATRKLLITSARDHLPAMVGAIYAEVVTKCLECTLPDESDDELACVVSVKVIAKLEQCYA
ncbi:hypothetical protein QBC39DRAFT_265862 [Podospora conica]|nr:hypothetical protein QBC39DRAFT_265862 [Schizothecium conicum]